MAKKSNTPKISRRKAMWHGALLMWLIDNTVSVPYEALVTDGIDRGKRLLVRDGLDPNILARMDPVDAENTKLLAKLFDYNRSSSLRLAGGREHFRFKGQGIWHHDNQWATETILRVFRDFEPEVQFSDTGVDDFLGSYALCGSPTSNARAAFMMGYEPIDPTKPELGFKISSQSPLRLPMWYELDSDWLVGNGHYMQANLSIDAEKTPAWGIRIGGEFLDTHHGEVDYLLVSRLPNWARANAVNSIEDMGVVVVVGGCTGAATGAAHLLVENGDLLRRFSSLTDQHQYWQALMKIDRIESKLHPVLQQDRFRAVSLPTGFVAAEPVKFA